MPKPHYPLNRRSVARVGSARRPRWESSPGNDAEQPKSQEVDSLVEEVERLRMALATALTVRSDPSSRAGAHVIWIAVAVCAMVLGFTALAIVNHG